MIYREIDKNGYFVRDVELDVNTDETKYIFENFGNMRKPKWTGTKWIDENPLDVFQEALKNKLNEITNIANNFILSRYSDVKQRKGMTMMLKLLTLGKDNWTETENATYIELQKIDDWISGIRQQENAMQLEVNQFENTYEIVNYKIEFITE